MDERFAFLRSNRFWAVVIMAFVTYLKSRDFIGSQEMVLVQTILGAFVGIRTIDRLGEKIGKK